MAGVILNGKRGPTTPALTVNVVSLLTPPMPTFDPPTLPTNDDLPFKSTLNTEDVSIEIPSSRTRVLTKSRSCELSLRARTETIPV
jgi:hypothetical protein